jgi:hypothetical protein
MITPPRNEEVRRRIVRKQFPEAVEMAEGCKWTLPCPGLHLHNLAAGVNRAEDCNIFESVHPDYEGALLFVCMHQSCKSLLVEPRKKLLRAVYRAEMEAAGLWKIGMSSRKSLPLPSSQVRLISKAAREAGAVARDVEARMRDLAKRALAIEPLAANQDPGADMLDQTRRHLNALYAPSDRIWSGEVFHGVPTEVSHILQCCEWGCTPGPFIGMCRFKEGAIHRYNSEVMDTPWVVLEADWAEPRQGITGGEWTRRLAACLQEEGIPTRCMVDTGGKSVHAWVSRPAYFKKYGDGLVDTLRNKLTREILGIDSATFTLSQPVRLAGIWGRKPDGTPRARPATLIYLQG